MLMRDSTERRGNDQSYLKNRSMVTEPWLDGIGFGVFLEKVRSRRRMISNLFFAGCAAGLLAGLLYTTVKVPTFSASSELLVSNTNLQLSGPDAVVTQLLVENSLIQSAIEMLKSSRVLDRVIDTVGLDPVERMLPKPNRLRELLRLSAGDYSSADRRQNAVTTLRTNTSVNRVGASQIISVRARALTPEDAANLTNALAKAFVQEQNDISAVVSTSAALRERIKVLGPTARIVSEAFPPNSKDVPTPLALSLSVLGAGALSLFIGLGLTLFDRRVRSGTQLAAIAPAEFFGHVPRVDRARVLDDDNFELEPLDTVLRRARSAVLERMGGIPHLVGVTAGSRGRKTAIAGRWASLIARDGSRVLLVEACQDESSGLRDLSPWESQGLHEVLRGQAALVDVVQAEINQNLDFLPIGNACAHLDTLWPNLVQAIGDGPDCPYDWIIVDLPPLAGADVRSAGQIVDHLLVVLEWGATSESELRRALRALGPFGDRVLGTIISETPCGSLIPELLPRNGIRSTLRQKQTVASARKQPSVNSVQ